MEKEVNFKDLTQEAIKRGLITLIHTDRTGVKHKVSEMSDSYLLNCIKYAIKKKEEDAFWDAVL